MKHLIVVLLLILSALFINCSKNQSLPAFDLLPEAGVESGVIPIDGSAVFPADSGAKSEADAALEEPTWLLYQNPSEQFSFYYPQSLTPQGRKDIGEKENTVFVLELWKTQPPPLTSESADDRVSDIQLFADTLPLTEVLKEFELSIITREIVSVGWRNYILILYKNDAPALSSESQSLVYLWEKNGRVLGLQGLVEDRSLFEEILEKNQGGEK